MMNALVLAVAILAHEPGYYTSLANHIQRWLRGEGVAAKVSTPREMPTALARERIAFLVGFEKPTEGELKTLRAFTGRGGKLVVFHSGSPALGALLGVKPTGYANAPYPGAWSRMDFVAKTPAGLPQAVRQTSSVLQRAVPIAGKGRVMATWSDRSGRSTGEPAWIASANGYWMTHVLLADGDEDLKARLCAALVGGADPSAWSYAAHVARQQAAQKNLAAYAAQQAARPGEIRAVWEHSGCGLYPGNWTKTVAVLKSAHVTDLFVNVAGAGFAHYASNVLPRSKTFDQEGDQLAACLRAAKGSGIRVHAWVLCFTGSRATPDRLEVFRKRGWRLAAANGKLTEYLNPAHPDVQRHVLAAIDEILAHYVVDGIHLDFVRWGDAAVKPKNACDSVTRFVLAVRNRVRRPKWLTAAVYGKYPNCVTSVGQDWVGWQRANLVDYVVPMDYTESQATFRALLAQQASNPAFARKTIVGIGVTANESRLDARQVIDQINQTRRSGLAGNALFDLDATLESRILPYLKMGVWR